MSFGASSSTSSGTPTLSANLSLSEKMNRDNFLVWQTMILSEIRGAQLFGLLDGSMPEPARETKATDKDGKEIFVPNPEYARWISLDQCVLGFLVRNMSREMITQMVGQTSSGGVWKAVTEMFLSQSKARVVQLRTQLNKAQKENKTAEVYFNHIKNLADEMAAAGKPLAEDDVISYVLAGLNDEAYNGFVAAITALIKADKYISLSDLYSQLLFI
jgi:hypothetical protein